MGWISKHVSAAGHEGVAQIISADGDELGSPATGAVPVIGWIAKCSCGWAGPLMTLAADYRDHAPSRRCFYVSTEDVGFIHYDFDAGYLIGALRDDWILHIAPLTREAEISEARELVRLAHQALTQRLNRTATKTGID